MVQKQILRGRDAKPDEPHVMLSNSTPEEARILFAMADIKSAGMTIAKIAERADVIEPVVMAALSDPDFQLKLSALRRHTCAGFLDDIRGIFKATEESAKIIGRAGAADRKLVFQFLDLMPDRGAARVNMIQQVNNNVTTNVGLTDANLLWIYLNGRMPRSRWLPSIADRYDSGHLKPEAPPDDGAPEHTMPHLIIEAEATGEAGEAVEQTPPSEAQEPYPDIP
jgi:hypothetical protein